MIKKFALPPALAVSFPPILALIFALSTDTARSQEFLTKAQENAAPPEKPLKKILVFTKSSEYVDPMIRQADGQPSALQTGLWDLGKENHIQFTFTADGSVFTPENLAGYDAFCFFTSGDLTQAGADRNPPMAQAGKAALLQAIRGGKGFIGIHSAADTFHSGPDGKDPYIEMLGGELQDRVRGLEPARQIVADTNFPGLGTVPADFAPVEEWYSFRKYATNLHALLVMDTTNMVRGSYYAPNYPSTWARTYGQGRVFYTALGHEQRVWNDPVFRKILAGGMDWADGATNADVSPNIERAAPGVRKN